MSVKTVSKRMTRVMRAAIRETISPANQGSGAPATLRPLSEAGDVSRQFGHELHQRLSTYTGSVDEFGCPGNTVDSWRQLFSRREGELEAANMADSARRKSGRG